MLSGRYQGSLALVLDRWWMANDEMMVSKRPSAGSGSDKSCWTSSTRSSPTKRLRAVEHDLGEVETHTMHLRMACLEHGEQTPIARTEVEDPANIPRHLFEQDALPFGPVRNSSARPR